MVMYETWYDFFFVSDPTGGAPPQRVIRERTIVIEPGEIHKETISFVPRTTVLARPYYRTALLFPRNDGADIQPSLAERGSNPARRQIKVQQAPEHGYVARYIEHLYYPDRDNEAEHAEYALPLLYVRRAFKETGAPAAIMFVANVPLAAYHMSPPPFRNIVEGSECGNELPEEVWHSLVFKRAPHEGANPFDLDCEESIRIKNYFMKFIVMEKYWRFILYVSKPKNNRAYGIYFPLPLMGFLGD